MRTTTVGNGHPRWPLIVNWLNSASGAQAAYNTKLHEAVATATREWQMFVGRRLKEDLYLVRELGAAKTPEQIWAISARFWQKAAEDYFHEYAVMAKLAGDCALFGVSASEPPPEVMSPLSNAA